MKDAPTSENSNSPSPPLCLDLPDADIIVRSSDQVNLPHPQISARHVVTIFQGPALSSPTTELVNGFPVIQLSEDAGPLNSLMSLLYPISPVIPSSYEKVSALLTACQKYDWYRFNPISVPGSNLEGFLRQSGSKLQCICHREAAWGLVPEMENAARLTLGYPMTLRIPWRTIAVIRGEVPVRHYRKRCRDNFVSYLDSFFDARSRFQLWAACRKSSP
ncbi:hypothetical protein EDB87DRAFT_145702 [Lactarius vividus]|nr:hypothetical protein EDB87DRAFT_145702 [Lactarius vividus]